jgi:hypothetical protein
LGGSGHNAVRVERDEPGNSPIHLAGTGDTAHLEVAMSESGASKLTALCTMLAAVGALVGLVFNSGAAPSGAAAAGTVSAGTAVSVAPVVRIVG